MSLLPPPAAPAAPPSPAPFESKPKTIENIMSCRRQEGEGREGEEEVGSYGPSYKNNKHHCNKWRNEFNTGFCTCLMIIKSNLRSKTSSRPFQKLTNKKRRKNVFFFFLLLLLLLLQTILQIDFAQYLAWLISVNYKSRLSFQFCKLFRKTFEKTRKKIKRQNICKNKMIT